jgi:hypothetical protein
MSNEMSVEELTAKIGELGLVIRNAKAEKKPDEEWQPALNEMLVLKVCARCLLLCVEMC